MNHWDEQRAFSLRQVASGIKTWDEVIAKWKKALDHWNAHTGEFASFQKAECERTITFFEGLKAAGKP